MTAVEFRRTTLAYSRFSKYHVTGASPSAMRELDFSKDLKHQTNIKGPSHTVLEDPVNVINIPV